MAFSSAPTLCEVTYNITEEEKRYTPFRYQCRSATTRANTPGGYSEITNYSLPSGLTVTYYEYLRSLYDSRIQSATKASFRGLKICSYYWILYWVWSPWCCSNPAQTRCTRYKFHDKVYCLLSCLKLNVHSF